MDTEEIVMPPVEIAHEPEAIVLESIPPEPRTTCPFADGDPLLRAYHEEEWGVPVLDSQKMWEALSLDIFSGGLSWLVVLRKRETMRAKLAGFDPSIIATWTWTQCETLLTDEDIVRSRNKMLALVQNAKAYEAMRANDEDFASFVWSLASTPELRRQELVEEMVDALKSRGFRNVGPIIVHAWLQGIGVWNDHLESCARKHEIEGLL